MVLIKDLRTGQGNVDVSGTITEIGNTRVFSKYGRDLKVANAVLQDESGSIKMTLWNEDVTRFSEGDKIKIVNGFVNEYQGEKQLTSGKLGRIEKLESSQNLESEDSSQIEKISSSQNSDSEESADESEDSTDVLEESEDISDKDSSDEN